MRRIRPCRSVYDTTNRRPRALCPRLRKRHSPSEWSGSGIVSSKGSPKTVMASANSTPCFSALAWAIPFKLHRPGGPRPIPASRNRRVKLVSQLFTRRHANQIVTTSTDGPPRRLSYCNGTVDRQGAGPTRETWVWWGSRAAITAMTPDTARPSASTARTNRRTA